MENDIIVTAANMSELTHEAFMFCLFEDGEDTSNHVRVEGITVTVGFHPQRLEEKRKLVTAILAKLPAKFKEGGTCVDLSFTNDGDFWGEPQVCEELVLMAIGLGLMSYLTPQYLWPLLPGGLPLFIVK